MTISTAGKGVSEYHLTAQTDINRPAAAVWALVADYSKDAQWRHGVSRMQPTPAGLVQVGTTTDESMRLGGSNYRNLGLITAVQPGSYFEWRTTDGADANGSRTVTPLTEDRCMLRMTVDVRVRGIQRTIAPLLAKLLQRNLNGDVRRLRELAERAR
ncbi:MAG: SRPBCC family protein [Nakamurella sp.]